MLDRLAAIATGSLPRPRQRPHWVSRSDRHRTSSRWGARGVAEAERLAV